MVKQASLKPKDAAIRKKYAGRDDKATQQKMNEEIMKLYQQENFNPMGGCLPLLIEMPIIYALYNVVNNPLKYISDFSAEIITKITEKISELASANTFIGDLMTSIGSKPLTQIQMINAMKEEFSAFKDILPADYTINSLPNFKIFGGLMDVSQTPNIKNISILLIIPVLTFVASFFSMKIIRKFSYVPEQTGDAGKSMKIMDWTMPLMSVWISFTVPAVIGIYWIYQNIISVVRQFILYKMYPFPKFTEEDYKKAEKEMNGKISRSERKQIKQKVRSLHRIDEMDEDSENEAEDETGTDESSAVDKPLIQKADLKTDDGKTENGTDDKRKKDPSEK